MFLNCKFLNLKRFYSFCKKSKQNQNYKLRMDIILLFETNLITCTKNFIKLNNNFHEKD